MRQSALNYAQAVPQACNALLKENIKPSVRKVHRKIGGGSFNEIAKHLSKWQQNQELAQATAPLCQDSCRLY